jgi:hypothetical protein
MIDYNPLLIKIKIFVRDFFREHKNKVYVYHDLRHTREVVEAARIITDFYEIKGSDYFIIATSAWFHDLGYLIDPSNHEEKGAEFAAKFLAAENVTEEIIQKVRGCIMATKLPQQPHNLAEEVICDADLFHFGTSKFGKRNKLLLEEYKNLHDHPMSKTAWQKSTIDAMETHHYFTDYGLLYLTRTKEKNIQNLKQKLYRDQPTINITMEHKTKSNHHLEENKGQKQERPERGAETMFRISSSNHSRLSQMADNKAHILITVNSIILSAVIGLVLRKLGNNAFLVVPSSILLLVSVTTIVFAILATRPTIPKGVFTPNDITEKKANLLFFGNFYKMDLEAYRSVLLEIIHDHDLLFDNLIRDIYSQGVVLGRKYQLLHIAYNVFMYGLVASVVVFIIASGVPHSDVQALPIIDSVHSLRHHIK